MKRRSLLLSLFLGFTCSTYSKVVIWDLGGVLFARSSMKMASSIGFSRFMGYLFIDRRNPFTQVEPLLFDVLNQVPCPPLKETMFACNYNGKPLPKIMCHWQTGTISGAEIITRSKDLIKSLDYQGYFISHREKILIKKTIEAMFNPSLLIDCMNPMRRTTRVFKECAHEVNENGSLRNINIALSNWDPASFHLLANRHSHTFSHFNHCVISGQCGFIKPWKSIYEYLIKTYKLIPSECIFIDDQEVNLIAAEKFGFNTYLMKGNYRELRKVLVEFGALDY